MVHQGKRLAFGLESGDDLPRVHAELDDFERHAAADWLFLLRHVNDSATTFADFLKQFVAPDAIASFFGQRRINCRSFGRGGGCRNRAGPALSRPLVFQEFTRPVVDLKQALEPFEHGLIIGARATQEFISRVARGNSKRLLENGFFMVHLSNSAPFAA